MSDNLVLSPLSVHYIKILTSDASGGDTWWKSITTAWIQALSSNDRLGTRWVNDL
jgi:hypothetical protein